MNPLMMLMQAARNGQNPMQMIRQIAPNNPVAAQALQIMQGKDSQQLRQTVENMARERGMTFDEVVNRMGLR